VKRKREHLIRDLTFIAISIVFAIYIVQSGVMHSFMPQMQSLSYLGIFLAGMLFTTAFTTAPAIALLAELAQEHSPFVVALIGALGTVIGDYFIFRFMRDRVGDDIRFLMQQAKFKRFPAIFKTKLFHLLLPLTGALLIASPLPDELGLALLGFSKLKTRTFLIVLYTVNVVGIYLIGSVAVLSAGGG